MVHFVLVFFSVSVQVYVNLPNVTVPSNHKEWNGINKMSVSLFYA